MTDETQLLTARRLMPVDVSHAEFRRARVGGVLEEDVEQFTELVRQELTRLIDERDTAWGELRQLRDGHNGAPGPEEMHGVSILEEAVATADRVTAEATAEAARLTGDAQRKRDQLLADAEEKIAGMLAAAEQEAATVRAQAPAEAQVRLARWQSLGTGLSGQLRALQEALGPVLEFWEDADVTATAPIRPVRQRRARTPAPDAEATDKA
jgi:cell division septum initiation protein DivIVA